LFNAFKIKEVTELGLGGNVLLSEIKKMQWTLEDGAEVPGQLHLICPPVYAPDFEVKLVPMMIRTFNLTVEFAQPFSKWDNSL
jgi:lysosomal alpha-mannosidase